MHANFQVDIGNSKATDIYFYCIEIANFGCWTYKLDDFGTYPTEFFVIMGDIFTLCMQIFMSISAIAKSQQVIFCSLSVFFSARANKSQTRTHI